MQRRGSRCLEEIIHLPELSRLEIFEASQNNITYFPDGFFRKVNPQLVVLDLSSNSLARLPGEIGLLQQLKRLHLAQNKLLTLPDEIGQLTRLDLLDVSSNALYELPSTLSQCTQLIYLDISGNKLSTLSLSLAKLRRLQWLTTTDNPWDFPFRELFNVLHPPNTLQKSHTPSNPQISSASPRSPMRVNFRKSAFDLMSHQRGSTDVSKSPQFAATPLVLNSAPPTVPPRAQSLFVANSSRPAHVAAPSNNSELLSGPVLMPAGNRVKWVMNYMLDLYMLDMLAKSGWTWFDVQDLGLPVDNSEDLMEHEETEEKEMRLATQHFYDTMKRNKIAQTRSSIVKEIIQSEVNYVQFLQTVSDLYLKPLESSNILTPEELRSIFSNWDSLLKMHKESLLVDLLKIDSADSSHSIGKIFIKHTAFIKLYITYVNNYDAAVAEMHRTLAKKKKFKAFCDQVRRNPDHRQPNLEFYLIMPVQRVPRYNLLLQDLLKNTTDQHPDYMALKEALNETKKRAQEINEHKRVQHLTELTIALQHRIKGTFATPLHQPYRNPNTGTGPRILLHSGLMEVGWYTKRGLKGKKSYLKSVQVGKLFLLVLFNDLLLQCKSTDQFGYTLAGQPFNLEAELKKGGSMWDLVRVIRWPKALQNHSGGTPMSPDTTSPTAGSGLMAAKRALVEKVFVAGRREMELPRPSGSPGGGDVFADLGVSLDEGRWALRLVDDDRVLYMWPPANSSASGVSDQSEALETWYKLITNAILDGN